MKRMETVSNTFVTSINNEKNFQPVVFNQMVQVLSITLIGIVASLIIFFCEIFINFVKFKFLQRSKINIEKKSTKYINC